MQAVITLPIPPSLNEAYANNKGAGRRGRVKTQKANAWEKEAGFLLSCAGLKPVHGRVFVQYAVAYKDRRTNDLANREKLLSDLLTKHGVIDDDSCIDIFQMVRLPVSPSNPQVEVLVRSIASL